jgi:hypothetical protein
MVAALFVTIGMAIMNAYHISWGTGYDSIVGSKCASLTAAGNI